jgi:hypothetical protein
MRVRILAVFLCLVLNGSARSQTLEQEIARLYDLQGRGSSLIQKKDQIRKDLMNGLLADMATRAIAKSVGDTADELDKRGFHVEASDARLGWKKYSRMVYEIRDSARPVGDHPGVLFLLNLHSQVVMLISEEICQTLGFTHDLWVFGMTIGVVFRCQDNVLPGEYFQHFSLLVGRVSYYVADIACLFTCPIPFVCSFAGMGVSKLVVLFVVPYVQQGAFNLACKKGDQ